MRWMWHLICEHYQIFWSLAYDNDGLLTQAGDMSLTRNSSNGLLESTTLGNTSSTYNYNSFGELIAASVIVDNSESTPPVIPGPVPNIFASLMGQAHPESVWLISVTFGTNSVVLPAKKRDAQLLCLLQSRVLDCYSL